MGFDSGICWSGDVWGYRNLCGLLCFAADVATFFPVGLFFGPDDVSKAANSGSNHCIMGADGADGFWIKT